VLLTSSLSGRIINDDAVSGNKRRGRLLGSYHRFTVGTVSLHSFAAGFFLACRVAFRQEGTRHLLGSHHSLLIAVSLQVLRVTAVGRKY
jgi:hypothetical protein